jgi:chitodextrinase
MKTLIVIAPALLALGLLGSAFPANAQQSWNSVTLTWTTPGDDSLNGTAAQFDLRYATSPITAGNFASATRVTGLPAPSAAGTPQTWVVTGLSPGTTYWFALKTADEVPNWSLLSNVVSKATTAAPDVQRPAPLAVAVSGSTDSSVTLQWTATGDDSLTGTAAAYDVRWSTSPITAANWASATPVTGEPAPAAPGTSQSYTVRGLQRQVAYWFAVKIADEAGNASALSNVVTVTTPDSMPPAAVRDMALGFLWLDLARAAVTPPRPGDRD